MQKHLITLLVKSIDVSYLREDLIRLKDFYLNQLLNDTIPIRLLIAQTTKGNLFKELFHLPGQELYWCRLNENLKTG